MAISILLHITLGAKGSIVVVVRQHSAVVACSHVIDKDFLVVLTLERPLFSDFFTGRSDSLPLAIEVLGRSGIGFSEP